MAMRKWKDLAVAIADERSESGKRWINVGVLLQDEQDPDRISIRINSIPIGWVDGWVSCFEPKARDEVPAQKAKPLGPPLTDDIPF